MNKKLKGARAIRVWNFDEEDAVTLSIEIVVWFRKIGWNFRWKWVYYGVLEITRIQN
jgi:hypothetical protein